MELEIKPDHAHLRCEVDPQFGIDRLVRRLKGRSSPFLGEEFPRLKSHLPTPWTNAYVVVTAGGAPLTVIKQSMGFAFRLPRYVRGRGTAQRGPRTTCVAGCGRAPPGGVERHSTGEWAVSAAQLRPGKRSETETVACES